MNRNNRKKSEQICSGANERQSKYKMTQKKEKNTNTKQKENFRGKKKLKMHAIELHHTPHTALRQNIRYEENRIKMIISYNISYVNMVRFG